MKYLKSVISIMAVASWSALFCACESDNIDPTETTGTNKKDTVYINSDTKMVTSYAKYPQGSIVWTHDTTLTASFEVPKNKSLYIEPGVTVTANSASDPKVEIVVLGNLYCMGAKAKPVTFTSDSKKPESWGGIICGYDSKEVVLDHAVIAYAGATPTESSLSFQNKLFKTTIDGGVPAFHFCNVNGNFVISNCVFHDSYNDQIYITGGNSIICNNTFYDSGNAQDGGEGINFKSGCKSDIAYNLIYNACTNGFKLSNSGTSETVGSSQLNVYNNTVVNTGWRRSKNKKGGSVWLEKGIAPVFVNNLIYDCRFGMKQPTTDGADLSKSVLAPNYYFASTAAGVKQCDSTKTSGVINFDSDIKSTSPGDKDPLFVNFSRTQNMNINCQSDKNSDGAPDDFNSSWDFHLQSGSPALLGSTPSFTALWTSGIAFYGLKQVDFISNSDERGFFYYSPMPSNYFGAFGQK
jgi:hypothetical protein